MDVLERAREGGTFLLNAPYAPEEAFARLPREVRVGLIRLKMRFFVIDARRIARKAGLGGRINTVMQTAFFQLAKVAPGAVEAVKKAIEKTYGRKSAELVRMNLAAVDAALSGLAEVKVPAGAGGGDGRPALVPAGAPEHVSKVMAAVMAGKGDALPVSAIPADGTFPTDTAKWEKRGIAAEIPYWDERWCIQCNKCAFVCPHATCWPSPTRSFPRACG